MLTPENKPKRKFPLALAIPGALLAMCCQIFVCISALSAFSDPPANLSTPALSVEEIQENAMQTAWAGITQTAAAATSLAPTSTETLIPTETPTITPLPTSTLASSVYSGGTCLANLQSQIGRVVEVVDGDTIRVRLDDGLVYSVRYIGIDTPESTAAKEYFGSESSAKNSEMVLGKDVTLYTDVSDKDRYGRLLRYVAVENIFVNYELVAQGYATSVSYPPDITCQSTFQEAQQTATNTKVGLWAAPTPTLPPLPVPGGGSENQVCLCSGNAYNCSDFPSRSAAQACFNYCISKGAGDVHRLDADSDGAVCESMP